MILLDKFDLLTWQFHDADLVSLEIIWSENSGVSVRLRCKVNFEEDTSELQALGIGTPTVDIQFLDVTIVEMNIRANCTPSEVLLDWNIFEQDSYHHRIQGSCGSQIDLRFRELGIAEVRT